MSKTDQVEIQEQVDLQCLCEALRVVIQEHNVSSLKVAELTGVPEANVRRMTSFQEPRATFIAKLERALHLPLGTVMMRAGLIDVEQTPESLLAVDPRLHPVYRRSAPEMVDMWVRLSTEERTRDAN